MVGSATGPGLDGSALALATDSIVAVIQYRLGAVRFPDVINPINISSSRPLAWLRGSQQSNQPWSERRC